MPPLNSAANGSTFARPLGEAAVEYGDGIVPQIAQHPPQPAGERARVLVVRDHLHAAGAVADGDAGDAAAAARDIVTLLGQGGDDKAAAHPQIEDMERAGLVSTMQSNGNREILVPNTNQEG